MKVRAQMGMVMNLDKCIGCHTCSVTCKNVWTNRPGTEYVWFNNVETKPGRGYPRDYEDQERWNGGWKLDRKRPAEAEGRRPAEEAGQHLLEPGPADARRLLRALDLRLRPPDQRPGQRRTSRSARPKSLVTGKDLDLQWGPNWDDDLAGSTDLGRPAIRTAATSRTRSSSSSSRRS